MKKTQDIVQYIRYNIKGILAYGCIFLVVFTILAGYTLYDRQMQLVIEYAPFTIRFCRQKLSIISRNRAVGLINL